MDDFKVWEPSVQETAAQFAAQLLGWTIRIGPASPRTAVGRLEQLSWYMDQLGLSPEQRRTLSEHVAAYVAEVRRSYQE